MSYFILAIAIYSPGLMKSDKPKSVAFKRESSLVDLKRKFYKKGRKCKGTHSRWIQFNLLFVLMIVAVPLVSCHDVLNRVNDTEQQP